MKRVFIIVLILIVVGIVAYYFLDTRSYKFTAEVDGVSFDATKISAEYTNNWLNINAVQTGTGLTMIMFHLNTAGTGTITLNSDNQEFGSGAAYSSGKTLETATLFATNSSSTGTVEISTLDLVGKKVSGSFDYRAAQLTRGGSGVVHVKGSFEDVPIK